MTHNKKASKVSLRTWLSVQLAFGGAFAASWFLLPGTQQQEVIAHVTHKPYHLDVTLQSEKATVVESLYNDAEVVSDEELAAVLKKILPRLQPRSSATEPCRTRITNMGIGNRIHKSGHYLRPADERVPYRYGEVRGLLGQEFHSADDRQRRWCACAIRRRSFGIRPSRSYAGRIDRSRIVARRQGVHDSPRDARSQYCH
jgi:hypothetical protein